MNEHLSKMNQAVLEAADRNLEKSVNSRAGFRISTEIQTLMAQRNEAKKVDSLHETPYECQLHDAERRARVESLQSNKL